MSKSRPAFKAIQGHLSPHRASANSLTPLLSAILVATLLAAPSVAATTAHVTSSENQLWSLDSPGISDSPDDFDILGAALAIGDFDNDGYDDLAMGMPRNDFISLFNIGGVLIVYGGANGLVGSGSQFFTQGTGTEGIEASDEFGSSLAAGDFDNDGFDDLAVGVPFEELGGGPQNSGAVNVFYGSPSGIDTDSIEFWHQDVALIEGQAEFQDRFGEVLATGDFDRDGFDDLAIGSPFDDVGSDNFDAGVVNVIFGGQNGLTASGSQLLRQGAPGISETAEPGDFFGTALATGDLDGDGFDELIVGASGESDGDISAHGVAHVFYGSAAGLSLTNDEVWSQAGNVNSTEEEFDTFGWAVASADFDGDGFDDVAFGVPGESHAATGISSAGAVNILYGSLGGLSDVGDQLLHQDTEGLLGTAELADRFGTTLAAGDIDDDGFGDLVVGVPNEDLGGLNSDQDAGAIHVIYGSATGLTTDGNQFLSENNDGLANGGTDDDERFGTSLAIGDFDADGLLEVAVAAPEEDLGDANDAGIVVVFTSALFQDGFESGDCSAWTLNFC